MTYFFVYIVHTLKSRLTFIDNHKKTGCNIQTHTIHNRNINDRHAIFYVRRCDTVFTRYLRAGVSVYLLVELKYGFCWQLPICTDYRVCMLHPSNYLRVTSSTNISLSVI